MGDRAKLGMAETVKTSELITPSVVVKFQSDMTIEQIVEEASKILIERADGEHKDSFALTPEGLLEMLRSEGYIK